jgi:4-diphosphocytidyl-2-C-methyl-D-erythritol kinase
VAAGIGGGSSDAAAALRLLARFNNLPLTHPAIREAANLTGADVPVCLDPRARMMRGAGEELGAALDLPRLFAVLVNPRVPVETPAVFRALGWEVGQHSRKEKHPAIVSASPSLLMEVLNETRNDLEPPACRLQPLVAEALSLVSETAGCRLARMSGSGATVFGLYDDCTMSAAASKRILRRRPDWWVKATSLR